MKNFQLIKEVQGNLLHQVSSINKFLLNLPLQKYKPMMSDRGNLLQNFERKICELVQKTRGYPNCAPKQVLDLVEVGQFFHALPSPTGRRKSIFSPRITLPRNQKGTLAQGWIQSNVRFGLSLGHKSDRIIFMSMFEEICGEENDQYRRMVIIILLKLGSMFADSIAVIGLSWDLDWKRHGTKFALTNQTESGTEITAMMTHPIGYRI